MDDTSNERRQIGDVCDSIVGDKTDAYDLVVLGVRVPRDTPALWLCVHMCCADNFVYVCLLKRV